MKARVSGCSGLLIGIVQLSILGLDPVVTGLGYRRPGAAIDFGINKRHQLRERSDLIVLVQIGLHECVHSIPHPASLVRLFAFLFVLGERDELEDELFVSLDMTKSCISERAMMTAAGTSSRTTSA